LVREHQPIARQDIDALLIDKLPEVLNEEQKKNKVHNLLNELARRGRLENRGSAYMSAWYIIDSGSNIKAKKEKSKP
jgi:ATP-dependent DNA helicase RecG